MYKPYVSVYEMSVEMAAWLTGGMAEWRANERKDSGGGNWESCRVIARAKVYDV